MRNAVLLLFFPGLYIHVSAQEAPDKMVKIFFEKPYLHTDREQYAAGEDIWFKAYLVNGQTNQLFDSSNNLYVELINAEAKVVDRKIIRLDYGLGKGDFVLDDSITNGTYRLRAYTSWMRNFGDNFLFEKQLQIVSDIAPREPGIEKARKKNQIEKKVFANVAAEPLKPASAISSINFFPEGGSLIEGVQCAVAIKTELAPGKGIAAHGMVKTVAGESITDFQTSESGFAKMLFQASPGTEYFAEGTYSNGRPFRKLLPQAMLKGFSLNVQNRDSILRIAVSTNNSTFTEFSGKKLTLLFKNKGKAFFSRTIDLADLQITALISKFNFPPGLTSITLYDPLARPQAERLIYNSGDGAVVNITPDKPVYQPKGKVTLTIKTTGKNNEPVSANLSLAVTDADIVQDNESNIAAYLNLQSELRGKIENPSQYFDKTDLSSKAKLDMLLLTQGWRDFTWKRLADSALKVSHIIEKGITISGNLRQVWLNKPVPGANISLTAWGSENGKLFSTVTDSSGRFYVDGIKLFGNQEIKITSVNNKGKGTGLIRVDTTVTSMYPINRMLIPDTLPGPQLFKQEMQRRIALAKRYRLSDTIGLKEVVINSFARGRIISDTTLVPGKGDYEMEYLRNYLLAKIPGAQICSAVPEHVVFNGIRPDGSFGRIHPMFSIEGPQAPRISPKQYEILALSRDYLNIPIDRIISVQLVHNKNRDGIVQGSTGSGRPVYDGLQCDMFDLFLQLRPGAFDRQGYQFININTDGYYEARTFAAPKYEKPANKTDLRTTIHWEPGITTNANGEATITYYNADPKTKVRIMAEGITNEGIPLVGSAIYNVK